MASTQISPSLQARVAGLVAWITTTAGFSAIVIGSLIVKGNPAATAHNILANEMLYRVAAAGDVVSVAYIVYTLLLYNLFRPVNRILATVAAVFSIVGIAVGMLLPVFEIAALVVLRDSQSLSGFDQRQVQAIAMFCLQLRAQVYAVSLVLFGTYNLLTGYLIFKSTFLPRFLGVLLAIAGLGYLINTFAGFLAPDFGARLTPWILIPGLSELLLAAWLLIRGVNDQTWKAMSFGPPTAGPAATGVAATQ